MDSKNLPVVILAGGAGMRLREHTEYVPKALIPIGNMPIILHVMKIYAHHGYNKFIVCLGYKGEMIKNFFLNHELMENDFILKFGQEKNIVNLARKIKDFEITFANTGLNTNTGGRIKKIEKYTDAENFFLTYCDGLADINARNILDFHLKTGKIATLTGVHPMSPFGAIEVENNLAVSFKEKPTLPGIINGGFFAFNRKVFDYLDDNCILEEEPLRKLTEEKQLAVFLHNGFWTCMDTHKDFERLNTLWERNYMPNIGFKGNPPWKIWNDENE